MEVKSEHLDRDQLRTQAETMVQTVTRMGDMIEKEGQYLNEQLATDQRAAEERRKEHAESKEQPRRERTD